MLTVVRMRTSLSIAAGQRSKIGKYKVPREESLPGFGMRMKIDDFQIAGFRHDVTESLKSAVRYSIALVPRFFKLKILSVSCPKTLVLLQLIIPLVTWSVVNISDVNDFHLISLDLAESNGKRCV